MAQTPYRFCILSGMPGYMPNYHSGAQIAHSRSELVDILKTELDMLDYPASFFGHLAIRNAWRFIQHHKSGSSVHLSTDTHNHEYFEVCGLTDSEYDEMAENDEF